jgi:hypothetical protein
MEAFNLVSITLDPNLQLIGDSAFADCFGLASITIPNRVTNLGFSTFYNCFNLTNAVIGTGLGSLRFQVFAYCSSLEGVHFTSNAPTMSSDVFDGVNAATAYCLPGTTGWSATFDGIPTAPWRPEIVASAVRTNQFNSLSTLIGPAAKRWWSKAAPTCPVPYGLRCRPTCSRAVPGISATRNGRIIPAVSIVPVRHERTFLELI